MPLWGPGEGVPRRQLESGASSDLAGQRRPLPLAWPRSGGDRGSGRRHLNPRDRAVKILGHRHTPCPPPLRGEIAQGPLAEDPSQHRLRPHAAVSEMKLRWKLPGRPFAPLPISSLPASPHQIKALARRVTGADRCSRAYCPHRCGPPTVDGTAGYSRRWPRALRRTWPNGWRVGDSGDATRGCPP